MRWRLRMLHSRLMEHNKALQKQHWKDRNYPNQQAQQAPAQLQQKCSSLRRRVETAVLPMRTVAAILLSNALRQQIAAILRHISTKTV